MKWPKTRVSKSTNGCIMAYGDFSRTSSGVLRESIPLNFNLGLSFFLTSTCSSACFQIQQASISADGLSQINRRRELVSASVRASGTRTSKDNDGRSERHGCRINIATRWRQRLEHSENYQQHDLGPCFIL